MSERPTWARAPQRSLSALSLSVSVTLGSALLPTGTEASPPSAAELIELGLEPKSPPPAGSLTLAHDLLRKGEPQAALRGPLSAPAPLTTLSSKERKAWGPDGLTALMKARDLATRTLRWRALSQLQALEEAATEAQGLLEEPSSPEALRDELRLSVARGLLLSIQAANEPQAEQVQALSAHLKRSLEAKRSRLVAEALSLHALLMETLNRPRAAQEARAELWRRYAHTPPGKLAPPPAAPSLKDWLSRGEHLFKERAYQPALEALSQLTQLGGLTVEPTVSRLERAQAALLSAVSLMRLRVTPQRADELLSLASRLLQSAAPEGATKAREALQTDVLRYQSILWSRQGRWGQAMEANRALIPRSQGARRDEASYQVGRLLHQAGRYQEAIESHKRLLSQGPRDPARVRWFLGWSSYRAGDCPSARASWAPLLKAPNLLEGPQALYWSAVCLLREGKARQTTSTLRQLFKSAPISYYGLLGRQLEAQMNKRALRWAHPLKRAQARHLKLARSPALVDITSARSWRRSPSPNPLWEALALKRSGLDGHARASWRAACDQPERQLKRSLGTRARLLCERTGRYVGATGELWRRGSRDQAGWRISGYGGFKSHPAELRVKAYPLAFEGLTRGAAAEEGLSPWWLLGHMLQESRFRPEVMSHAQAMGLMQILERTGQRISERLEWPPQPFSGEQLFKPGVALRLSAWYLKRLWLDLGHPILAMAAYNGGPMRVADHVEEHPSLSFTELIEELGAHESRNYMRKVVDHTLRYLALYGDEREWEEWIRQLALPERAPKPRREVGF